MSALEVIVLIVEIYEKTSSLDIWFKMLNIKFILINMCSYISSPKGDLIINKSLPCKLLPETTSSIIHWFQDWEIEKKIFINFWI